MANNREIAFLGLTVGGASFLMGGLVLFLAISQI
jgi:hypothetical protein